jgi:hypothetical protein
MYTQKTFFTHAREFSNNCFLTFATRPLQQLRSRRQGVERRHSSRPVLPDALNRHLSDGHVLTFLTRARQEHARRNESCRFGVRTPTQLHVQDRFFVNT